LPDDPVSLIDWKKVPATERKGEPGMSTHRAHKMGDVQMRIVTFSPGYVSDHWCSKGHIIMVLEGGGIIEHENGKQYQLAKGMTYAVGDGDHSPHRLSTQSGATFFMVD